MRLEGLRLQPGLHGSPSDAKFRPETARHGESYVGMVRTRAFLTIRI